MSRAFIAKGLYENLTKSDSTHFLSTFLPWSTELPNNITCYVQLEVKKLMWKCVVLGDRSLWESEWQEFLKRYGKREEKVEIMKARSMLAFQLVGISDCANVSACQSLEWPTRKKASGFKGMKVKR